MINIYDLGNDAMTSSCNNNNQSIQNSNIKQTERVGELMDKTNQIGHSHSHVTENIAPSPKSSVISSVSTGIYKNILMVCLNY